MLGWASLSKYSVLPAQGLGVPGCLQPSHHPSLDAKAGLLSCESALGFVFLYRLPSLTGARSTPLPWLSSVPGEKRKSLVVVFETGLLCLNTPASETGQTVTVTAACLEKVF